MNQSLKEQRKYQRITKEIPVKVSKLAYPLPRESIERCCSKNISAGGICFTTPKRYQIKTLLSLKISIRGWERYKKPFSRLVDISSESPLTAIGEVAWCQKCSNTSGYDIGIKFVNIYEDDYYALMKYLESF